MKLEKLRSRNSGRFRFLRNDVGDLMCPVCGIGMRLETTVAYRSPHFRCPASGTVFYGDEEELRVCLYSDVDVQL